jgi:hypothetical protein
MDISLLYITIILLILVVISIFQKLKIVTWLLIGSYLIYLIFVSVLDNKQIQESGGSTPEAATSFNNDIIQNESVLSDTLLATNKSIEYSPLLKELHVRSVAMTRAVQDRIATDIDTIFQSNVGYLYFHTIINNPEDTATIIHRWSHKGEFISQTEIKLGRSVRWRCWSRLALNPDWVGDWEASVLDSVGNFLTSTKFSIVN